MRITRRPSLSRLPEHLRRPRQHRGARRSALRLRGHELDVQAIGIGGSVPAGQIDLFYIGGGQDREQALVARDLVDEGRARCAKRSRQARRSSPSAAATSCSAASIGTSPEWSCPGSGCCRCTRSPGERRMIGDVLLDCAWAGRDDGRLREPRRAHDPRRGRRAARPRRLRLRQRRSDAATRDAARNRVYGTYLHGPLLPRNPWFADRMLAEALAHAGGPTELAGLPDELETEAHRVSAQRARARGGKF